MKHFQDEEYNSMKEYECSIMHHEDYDSMKDYEFSVFNHND